MNIELILPDYHDYTMRFGGILCHKELGLWRWTNGETALHDLPYCVFVLVYMTMIVVYQVRIPWLHYTSSDHCELAIGLPIFDPRKHNRCNRGLAKRWANGTAVSILTVHTTLSRRWINVNDVDSTPQQRRVPSGYIALADVPSRRLCLCKGSFGCHLPQKVIYLVDWFAVSRAGDQRIWPGSVQISASWQERCQRGKQRDPL